MNSQDAAAEVQVRGLTVSYRDRRGGRGWPAVSGLDFRIAAGEAYGLVGESGSGKTTAAMSLTRFLPIGAQIRADELTVAKTDVLALDRAGLRRFRARKVAVVYQEPGQALNPTMRVGAQVAEVLRLRGADRRSAAGGAVAALARVQLPDPEAAAQRYPHELSGGQQQRVVIAMALAADPRVLILDEPTTGLDSQVAAEIMALLDRLRAESRFATLLISHDLPLVAAHCDRLGVLRNGRIAEEGAATGVGSAPKYSYARDPAARRRAILPTVSSPVLTVQHVRKTYGRTVALDDVSLAVDAGEVLGIVGASGSGKTTLGRVVAGLTHPASGAVRVEGAPARIPPVQVVFQNPDASLNPRRTVRRVLTRAVRLLGGADTVEDLAARTGLDTVLLDRFPGRLSGGQKQRVAIARAFAGRSPLIVLDEPTSALDDATQEKILKLLIDLQERTGVAYLFISHDLAVVRRLAHRVGVLYEGRLVELADTDTVFTAPRHEYTRSLLDAAAVLRPDLVGAGRVGVQRGLQT